ncbi:hypothetical protein LCGC14_0347560 [marine sediment metagenome]|uniref:Uncharacterized protein n=1 Tax=marine sediment metagenome TaxID=412755 RepID=A0A0F9THG4_9ZZZZ
MTCSKCGSEMSTEDKVVAAIFANDSCAYCQRREEQGKYPDILVNGRPLATFIAELTYWDDLPFPDRIPDSGDHLIDALLEGEHDDEYNDYNSN